jgi:hypothetical protein
MNAAGYLRRAHASAIMALTAREDRRIWSVSENRSFVRKGFGDYENLLGLLASHSINFQVAKAFYYRHSVIDPLSSIFHPPSSLSLV